MAASIGAEVAGLAADKVEQRRIIAGTPERSNHTLKYNSNQRLWVIGRGPPPKVVNPCPKIDHLRMKPSPAPNFLPLM
jgi:hypothetical protein